MAHAYARLPEPPGGVSAAPRELSEAEEELLRLLKARGVPSLCDAVGREMSYAWAVASGFRTLAAVGNFYFACGSQAFGYNPARDFFAAHGAQLALFALHKFVHNEAVLEPVLDCLHVYCKLHVDGALEFLAVSDATEILLKCARFHDNKPDVISAACRAIGSLVMNDLVKETVSTPELLRELLGLLKRYHASQETCSAVLAPLGFLVTDADITTAFVDANGIALTMAAMKRFVGDTELVWHAIGVLNGLNAQTLDLRVIVAMHGNSGISRIVEALASHLDTEEIAVEGFQLLAKLAVHPDAYAAINRAKVLDLAYVALFAYSGPQHRHTRIEIKKTMYSFQKCTLYDSRELSQREQASRADLLLYALFVLCFALTSVLSLYDRHSSDLVLGVQHALVDKKWPHSSVSPSPPAAHPASVTASSLGRSLKDVNSVEDVWSYMLHPLHESLFQDRWYNGDLFVDDTVSQLGFVDRANVLLGGLQLRLLRVDHTPCGSQQQQQACYPPYSRDVELKSAFVTATRFTDASWSDANPDAHRHFQGKLAVYPASGYRQFISRLNASTATSGNCGAYCQLSKLKSAKWIDPSSRALFVEFNMYNAVVDVHCAVTILFEFAATGGVLVTSALTPLHLDQYPGGVFIFAPRFYAELATLTLLVWFAHKQVVKLERYHWFYFVVAGHVVDFAIVAIWVAAIAMRVQLIVRAAHPLLVRLAANDSFVDLTELVHLVHTERCLMAWAGVFMWWRLVRFARCLKPLEQVMDKFERAESLLGAFVFILLLYVVGFAQAGGLLFPPPQSDFRSFSTSIVTMATSVFKRGLWTESTASGVSAVLFRLLFQLSTAFVVLNIVVAILRERFDSERVVESEKAANGESLLEIARKQLEANGMSVVETSLPKKLKQAATRGLERLQHATREMFTISDEPTELTNLKRVWGLHGGESSANDDEPQTLSAASRTQHLLRSAEDLDRHLDQQLSFFALRIEDATRKLQLFHKSLRQQIEEKKQLQSKENPRDVAPEAAAAAAAASTSPEKTSLSDNETRGEDSETTAFVPATTHAHHAAALAVEPSVAMLLPGAVTTADDHEEDEGEARDHA